VPGYLLAGVTDVVTKLRAGSGTRVLADLLSEPLLAAGKLFGESPSLIEPLTEILRVDGREVIGKLFQLPGRAFRFSRGRLTRVIPQFVQPLLHRFARQTCLVARRLTDSVPSLELPLKFRQLGSQSFLDGRYFGPRRMLQLTL
jgi:hypothetical protein